MDFTKEDDSQEAMEEVIELDDDLIKSLEAKPKKHPHYPKELFIFPCVKRPYFPGMATPIIIDSGRYYEALKALSKSDEKCIGIFLTKNEDADIEKISTEDLYKIGVVARVLRITPMDQGGAQIIISMEDRVKLVSSVHHDKLLCAKVSYFHEKAEQSEELKAYAISIISTIKELLKLNPLFKEELQIFLSHSDFTEAGRIADFAVALTTASRQELQEVLETIDVHERIDKALLLLKKEVDLSKLQKSIHQKIETGINKTQREYYLREQLKTIKRELGLEKEEKGLDKTKFEARLKEKKIPDDVKTVIEEEMEKLSVLEPQSSEYALCRNYLDWLTILPWGVTSKDIPSLEQAKKILENDHWGLHDVKKRIIEFISVLKLSGSLKGTILCLVGPPGVGKTSIGKSIARALNRSFFRFSVGGMQDEAEIKGHRRTYIGAMPGKIVQALKTCKTMNPVIMLDEVDKIGKSYHGDPASALLEVLDPEQNVDFLDHYLDVRCDLSNILFILTANVLDSIPEPLLDRMEVIRLSGYIREEKIEIADRFLIPKQYKETGLKASNCEIERHALRKIIDDYAREAGVRSLENNIKKIFRKIAVDLVDRNEKKKKRHKTIHVGPKDLVSYLGKPVFHSDRYYDESPIGVAAGLAWTALGGSTLFVESIKVPHEKTEMKLTGHAGQVMKESAEIAWSFVQGTLERYAPGDSFFKRAQVHLHFPEGATPKDGPSAGITIVTSLLSLLLQQPVMKDLAMTGELTLTGQILPIGGVKEKLVAAKRSGFKTVLIPKGNVRDYDELSKEVKEGLDIRFVNHYDDVVHIAFPHLQRRLKSHENKRTNSR